MERPKGFHSSVTLLESIQGTRSLSFKMGRQDEQKHLMHCIRYRFQIFRNTPSRKQWYLQIGMLDVCGSLESTLGHFITLWKIPPSWIVTHPIKTVYHFVFWETIAHNRKKLLFGVYFAFFFGTTRSVTPISYINMKIPCYNLNIFKIEKKLMNQFFSQSKMVLNKHLLSFLKLTSTGPLGSIFLFWMAISQNWAMLDPVFFTEFSCKHNEEQNN